MIYVEWIYVFFTLGPWDPSDYRVFCDISKICEEGNNCPEHYISTMTALARVYNQKNDLSVNKQCSTDIVPPHVSYAFVNSVHQAHFTSFVHKRTYNSCNDIFPNYSPL